MSAKQECFYRGAASDAQGIPNTPAKVRDWSCTARGTEWLISVVNPPLFLDRLVTTADLAAARPVLVTKLDNGTLILQERPDGDQDEAQ